MWPLKMSERPSSTANKMDGKANSYIHKWLGLPRCLSETGPFGRNPKKSLQRRRACGSGWGGRTSIGKKTITPKTVPVLAPPPGDVSGLKERNIGEWWFLADDPADNPWAPQEVRPAEDSTFLCIISARHFRLHPSAWGWRGSCSAEPFIGSIWDDLSISTYYSKKVSIIFLIESSVNVLDCPNRMNPCNIYNIHYSNGVEG